MDYRGDPLEYIPVPKELYITKPKDFTDLVVRESPKGTITALINICVASLHLFHIINKEPTRDDWAFRAKVVVDYVKKEPEKQFAKSILRFIKYLVPVDDYETALRALRALIREIKKTI